MIHILTTAPHTYTVGDYLKSWAGTTSRRFKLLSYETLPTILPRGTYIFSDLERLSREQAVLAAEVWEQLAGAGTAIRLFNHPLHAARRLTVLQRLHAGGWNSFRAFRATDSVADVRFPVFVRQESEHRGSLSGLLRDRREVDHAIVRLLLSGVPAEDILIVEFCDTSQDRLYRKYAAFRVGDRIIPRHIVFSAKWVLKGADLLDAAKIREEREYLESNPHQDDLRKIFDCARIEYGRIDYGLLDGRIQTWEINTNPGIMLPPDKYKREQMPNLEAFAAQLRLAFDAIDCDGSAQPMVPIDLTDCANRLRAGDQSTAQ
jgi:hypothetical protein